MQNVGVGSDLSSLPLSICRYDQEAYKHASVQNDFVVLKKVGGAQTPRKPLLRPKPGPRLGGQRVEIVTESTLTL